MRPVEVEAGLADTEESNQVPGRRLGFWVWGFLGFGVFGFRGFGVFGFRVFGFRVREWRRGPLIIKKVSQSFRVWGILEIRN